MKGQWLESLAAECDLSTRGKVSGLLLGALWAVELLRLVLPDRGLTMPAGVLLALYMALAFWQARWQIRAICASLIMLTTAIIWRWGHSEALSAALEIALAFAAFFASLQLLRAIAERDPRVVYLRRHSRAMAPGARRTLTLLTSHFLGAILATGVLAVMAPTVPSRAAPSERITAAESALLGLGLAIVWSPFFVAMAIVTALSPAVHEWQLISCGMLVGVLGLILANRRLNGEGWQVFWAVSRTARPLFAVCLTLAAIIIGLTITTGLSNLEAVVLSAQLLSAFALRRRSAAAWVQVGTRTFVGLTRVHEETMLVVGAMFFGQAILATPEINAVLVSGWLTGYPSALYLFAAGATMVGAALVGVHPLVTASVILPLLHKLPTGASDLAIALTVLAGWGTSVIVSMWVVPVIVGSAMFRVSPTQLALGANFRIALEFLVVSIGAIAFAQYFLRSFVG